jgi:uncharacterized Zn finger protein (UPF0148 family)
MKYYCKNCGSVLAEGDNTGRSDDYEVYCPMCEDEDYKAVRMEPIPDYETPERYEKSTGKAIDPMTAVWFRIPDDESFNNWVLLHYADALQYERYSEEADFAPTVYIVIADPPVPPPDDWKPEEVTE